MRKITKGVIHHTAGAMLPLKKVLKGINENHKARLHTGRWGRTGKNGKGYHIAYHYIVDLEGNSKNTRPEEEIGYHSGKWFLNDKSISIALAGNFSIQNLGKDQSNELKRLVSAVSARHALKREDWIFHKDVKATQCPGNNLNKKEIFDFIFEEKEISEWAEESVEKAIARGIATKWENPQEIVGSKTLGYILKNLGLISKVSKTGVTKEQVIVAADRAGLLD